mmetsp:Transcript_161551/g.513429  ORF Transcript_161551/g.513429 Transcript_161551/m.513429 type:complete len:162 (+) Transcript_161551:1221-1706(+)
MNTRRSRSCTPLWGVGTTSPTSTPCSTDARWAPDPPPRADAGICWDQRPPRSHEVYWSGQGGMCFFRDESCLGSLEAEANHDVWIKSPAERMLADGWEASFTPDLRASKSMFRSVGALPVIAGVAALCSLAVLVVRASRSARGASGAAWARMLAADVPELE